MYDLNDAAGMKVWAGGVGGGFGGQIIFPHSVWNKVSGHEPPLHHVHYSKQISYHPQQNVFRTGEGWLM
jgi:hypothetical protein